MKRTAENLVSIAAEEVGYLEKKTNSKLDSKTENAGSNNWTKYARDLKTAGYYNGNKNGYAWCDVFVDWCFYQLCDGNKEEAEAMECQTGVYGAGCTYSANYYKAQGRFDQKPMVGDQIFFKTSGSAGSSHTGIIESLKDGYIYTIEGNSSNKVQRKSYKLGSSSIYGFGHPRYETEESIGEAEFPIDFPTEFDNNQEDTVKTNTVTITTFELKKTSEGNTVKTLQALLNSKNNAKLTVDGKFGPLTDTAVRKYQSLKSLSVDGVVGEMTWTALINGG